MDLDWPKESCVRWWSRSSHGKGQFLRKGVPVVKYLPWAVQKQLNRLICLLGGRRGWAEASTSSIVFAWWCHCAQFQSCSPGGANDTLPWAVQNRLNRSICHLVVDSGGTKEAQIHRIRQVAPTCPLGRAHWRHLANSIELSVCAAVRFCVKLLWPLLGIRSIMLSSVLGFRYFSVSIMRLTCENNLHV